VYNLHLLSSYYSFALFSIVLFDWPHYASDTVQFRLSPIQRHVYNWFWNHSLFSVCCRVLLPFFGWLSQMRHLLHPHHGGRTPYYQQSYRSQRRISIDPAAFIDRIDYYELIVVSGFIYLLSIHALNYRTSGRYFSSARRSRLPSNSHFYANITPLPTN